MTALVVFAASALAYALNTCKTRAIAGGRRVASVVLEGMQAVAFLLFVAGAASESLGRPGLAAYVLGAMTGTLVAVVRARHSRDAQAPLVMTQITVEGECGLASINCPWCDRPAERLEHVTVLRRGDQMTFGYRCPACGRCVLRPTTTALTPGQPAAR